jgi:predicted peptidase
MPYTGKYLLLGLIQPALYELGAIMVAPDRNRSDWDNPQSEEEILNLFSYLQSLYLIDPAHTLITGYSLGGIGTWRLAAYHNDKFAAALPIAANPPQYVLDTQWEIPIYVIHGQEDEYFPLNQTQSIIEQLRSTGADIEFVAVDRGTHFNTDGYVKPLHGAIPWIQRVWENQ